MIQNMLMIGAGGFIGSALRYGVSEAVVRILSTQHPVGTFVVNILGSFILGLVLGLSQNGEIVTESKKLFFAVGFCGGFTTFSTFAFENFSMIQSQQFFLSIIYAGVSLILGLSAVYGGFRLSAISL